jgi:hypothetical protein
MINTAEIIDKGMSCLLERLGVIETEQFISVILRERFDYTNWQRGHFDFMNSEEFNQAALRYAKQNPF